MVLGSMHILFIAQLGLPAPEGYSREKRVEALAIELAKAGHNVSVTCARPFIPANIKRYQGVKLIHHASLNPQKPGGWLYNLLCLYTLWKIQPDVVHGHGWLAGSLLGIATQLSPETTFVWTIDSLPKSKWLAKIIVWANVANADAITSPTRQLQYRLLHELHLPVTYIPDGYSVLNLPDLPRKLLDLGRGKYSLVITDEAKIPTWISRAHKAAKLPGKLIVSAGMTGRKLTSTINQAEFIILAGQVSTEIILHAMAAGKEIIATTNPHFEETLGVTAQFVVEGNTKQLRHALEAIKTGEKSYGQTATKRASRHFQWTRILPEYLSLYHYPAVKIVPLDSLIGVQTPQTAVR